MVIKSFRSFHILAFQTSDYNPQGLYSFTILIWNEGLFERFIKTIIQDPAADEETH